MEWEAFFSRSYKHITRMVGWAFHRPVYFREILKRAFPEAGSQPVLSGGFGEDVHPVDLGRYPKLRAFFLDSHDRRLAAHPAFFTRGEFRGENQHQFDVGTLLYAGFGIEENSIGADIAGLRSLVNALNRTNARGNASGDSSSGAALGVLHDGGTTVHQGDESYEKFRASREARIPDWHYQLGWADSVLADWN
jgi:hypothetical protein